MFAQRPNAKRNECTPTNMLLIPFNIQTRQQSMPNLCYAIFQYVHILKVMKTDILGLELPKYF